MTFSVFLKHLDRFLAVLGVLDFGAELCKKRHYYLSIELIVLGKQEPSAREVDLGDLFREVCRGTHGRR